MRRLLKPGDRPEPHPSRTPWVYQRGREGRGPSMPRLPFERDGLADLVVHADRAIVVGDRQRRCGRAKRPQFSEWATYSPAQQQTLPAASCQTAMDGTMPGSAWTLLHPEARLSAQDIQTLCIAARQAR
jgi:Haem-binding domain